MLPLPLFAVTDVAGTVAIVEGLNDNVVQTQDTPTTRTRHPSLFTGVDTALILRMSKPNTDISGFRLRVRSQFYEPLDGYPENPDGTVQGLYSSIVTVGKNTRLNFSLSSTLSRVTSARVSDGTLLFQVDPSSTATTFTYSQATMGITQELSERWRFRQSIGLLMTTTVEAPPFQLANNLELDRRGIDGLQPFSTTTVIRELGPRDTGDVSVTYRYSYSPYTLDFATQPPQVGAPNRIHQILPDVGLNHVFSPKTLTRTRLGVSFATPPLFEADRALIILPTASEELHYTEQRWALVAVSSFGYGTIAPRLGAGPTFGGSASVYGIPWTAGGLKNLLVLVSATASHSSLRATLPSSTGGPSNSTNLTVFGLSLEGRYALSRTFGVLGGYDAHYSTLGTTTGPSIPYFRQIFFIGISGYWSTDRGQLPPLEQLNAPFRPG